MTESIDLGQLDTIIDGYQPRESSLIQVLQDIQATWNYLPRPALDRVAERLDVPIARVFAVATFYKAFSLKPRGRHICKVCVGTACHIRGAAGLVDELERVLDIQAGKTTEDGEFTLETVGCVGACAMAPLVIVDGQYHGGVAPHQMAALVDGKGGSDETQ